jgi:succinate dehydrogenase/fumarate reductase flavoprotein subunit
MRAYGVLIIGAVLAGQRAALAAAETGVSVGIVSKVHDSAQADRRGGDLIRAASESTKPHAEGRFRSRVHRSHDPRLIHKPLALVPREA